MNGPVRLANGTTQKYLCKYVYYDNEQNAKMTAIIHIVHSESITDKKQSRVGLLSNLRMPKFFSILSIGIPNKNLIKHTTDYYLSNNLV